MTNIIETAKNSFSLWLNTWWEALPFGIAATLVERKTGFMVAIKNINREASGT